MQRVRILIILGVWVAVLPYLGFPYSWKNILFTVSGLGLVSFGYMLRKESKSKEQGNDEETFENFSENSDFKEDEASENEEPLNETQDKPLTEEILNK